MLGNDIVDELLKATERSQAPSRGWRKVSKFITQMLHGIGIFTQTFLLNVAYVAIFHLSCR